MSKARHLDAHKRPPVWMRPIFKKYQKCTAEDLDADPDLIDTFSIDDRLPHLLRPVSSPILEGHRNTFGDFLPSFSEESREADFRSSSAFEVTSIPGLYVFPSLFPPEIQIALLDRLLHRSLSNPSHRTNVHLHHDIVYPESLSSNRVSSFFSQNTSTTFLARDPDTHKQLNVNDFLEKKLRWMTLGAQYDWTEKCYPTKGASPFPADLKSLLSGLFPATDAQAAIVNFYSSGDTLSLHRDVSEYCDEGLVSISIGCDGLFIIGNPDSFETVTIRLSTGDALYMTGASRYAWHGIPKIIPNTCPDWLGEWPSLNNDTQYSEWRGWMSRKRININVRQVTQTPQA